MINSFSNYGRMEQEHPTLKNTTSLKLNCTNDVLVLFESGITNSYLKQERLIANMKQPELNAFLGVSNVMKSRCDRYVRYLEEEIVKMRAMRNKGEISKKRFNMRWTAIRHLIVAVRKASKSFIESGLQTLIPELDITYNEVLDIINSFNER